MSTHKNKKHRKAMPLEALLTMTESNGLIWRENHTPDIGFPAALRPSPDRSQYFSDWMDCLVTPVDHTWYDTRVNGKKLFLAESTPSIPTLPTIIELYYINYNGYARILAADAEDEEFAADASLIWRLLKAIKKQWTFEVPDNVDAFIGADAADVPKLSETVDEYYVDRDGVTLQRLFRIVGRDRLCDLYADFWSGKIADRDGLSDCETDHVFLEYVREACRLIPSDLDVEPEPSTARLIVEQEASRHEPDRWRLTIGCSGDVVHLASITIPSDIFANLLVCPLYWSTRFLDSAAARNRIRRKALEDTALIVMCWLARMIKSR